MSVHQSIHTLDHQVLSQDQQSSTNDRNTREYDRSERSKVNRLEPRSGTGSSSRRGVGDVGTRSRVGSGDGTTSGSGGGSTGGGCAGGGGRGGHRGRDGGGTSDERGLGDDLEVGGVDTVCEDERDVISLGDCEGEQLSLYSLEMVW